MKVLLVLYNISILGVSRHTISSVIPAILRSKKVKLNKLYTATGNVRRIQIEKKRLSVIDWHKLPQEKEFTNQWLYIALPPALHFSFALQGMFKGFNVIIEKPMSTNVTLSKKLIDYAQKLELSIFEVNMYPFHCQFEIIKQFFYKMKKGTVITKFSIPHLPKSDFRYKKNLGGGALLDLGFYPLSLLTLLSKKCEIINCKLKQNGEIDEGGSIEAIINGGIEFKGYWHLDSNYENKIELVSEKFSVE